MGDGYQRKSPHTYKEMFEGLNILDAAKVLPVSSLRTLFTYVHYTVYIHDNARQIPEAASDFQSKNRAAMYRCTACVILTYMYTIHICTICSVRT